MAQTTAGIDPGATVQGGTGSLTITLPGCVEIKPGQPGTPDSSGGMGSGAIVAFAGSDAPEGWLLCNGAAINRTTYATLFGVISETYGVGNGNTTFHLPDLRGRFPLGLDNMGGTSADRVTAAEADALNGNGGAETHTLTEGELASHSHQPYVNNRSSGSSSPGWRDLGPNTVNRIATLAFHTISRYVAGARHSNQFDPPREDGSSYQTRETGTTSTGDNQAHNNMPPYLSLNYIIKT